MQSEEILALSEQRFRTIFDSVNDAIFVHDLSTGAILDVNAKMLEIYGYTREEALYLSIGDLSSGEPPYTQENALECIHKAEREGPQVFEWREKDKSGHLFWVEVNMRIAAIGGHNRLLVVTRDISERKQAEEAQRQEQSFIRTIIDSIPGTFYMLDAEGRYVRWNAPQRDEIVGRPESQMTDVYAIDTIHPDDRALIASRIGNVLANGVEEAVEGRILLRGGPAFRWFLMTGRRIIIDGRPFLVGVGVDITERRQAQEQYRGLFEAMLEGFAYCRMLYDAQGHAVDWVYLAANPAFEQLTGLTNPVGKRVTEAIPGVRGSSPELFEIYGRVVSTGQPERFEIYFTPLSKWLDISVVRPAEGCFAAVFADISARKQAEAERERLIGELRKTVAEVKTLRGFIPICAWCKKICDDEGYWTQVETYVSEHSHAEFSHGICPECMSKLHSR